ncbi:twin-arginine translocase TatA/TatE family subunit [Flavobacterium salilacus subsp. salilacus]|uniref:Sec-independent protein translocase subunit TatA/TatB n=1 Tax=Flavobacterium TaxID=237 RepID=UPI001074B0A8|nr:MULTISPECIES: twin-arginine translocase TatA/TatE family subunit [Flavobacterium]KAF2518135.1 twin-arginine translocase TatA/TatE family subunit [Flavobacterium salilacus subsp. salilacus]MBE1615555.1 twin-arginine translocase TatA/TatE family subunit [Flavobacterium sp. SaA2.13]NDI99358.1 twin-arginine translocase TatA/TatE family subunit [Flavobacterium salilacus subsp. altitudinum]
MFGIGGGELFFIILVVLMLFGSDKVPEMARTLGKGMQQLKNATNDIKSEIHKSAEVQDIKKTINDIGADNVSKEMTDEVNKIKEDVESVSGPVKRMK